MLNKFTILLLMFFLFASMSAQADEDGMQPPKISGYYKSLGTYSKTLSTKEDAFMLLNRLRFKLDQRFTENLNAVLTYDNEVIVSNFSDTPDFDLIRAKDQRRLAMWDLDEVFIDEDHFYWKHSVYRLYLEFHSPEFRCVVGKQGIDWSRMRFYHPFDFFNPVSPLDIEGDERVGVDAVNLEYYPQEFMMINFIYAPGWGREKQGLGARFSTKIHDYDLFFLGGDVRKDRFLGTGFDGYVGEAGFRGEVAYTFPDDRYGFLRGSVGLDYSFTRKLYGIAEYFYNGMAKDKNIAQFLNSYEYSRRAMSLKKHIFGAGLEYELSGITKLNNYLFFDLEGPSFYYNPVFKWNIMPNFDITCGAQVFEDFGNDDDNTEYGNYHNLYYAEMQYYF